MARERERGKEREGRRDKWEERERGRRDIGRFGGGLEERER